jgi:molybdopterin molybdotransferase
MLSVEEAQARVLAEISIGPAEPASFHELLGRVLREDIIATRDLPPADNSAMDGYAVRAHDLHDVPVRLPVTDDIAAGHPTSRVLDPGTAMRIMTGAFVPDGADTVVQVELTDGGMDAVTIEKALARGANIRRRGEDMRAGDVVIGSGVRIGPAEMAVLASVGKQAVSVGRRPRVAILSTGDELVESHEQLAPGKIFNTNGPLLAALVREVGAEPRELAIVRDSKEATIEAFEIALRADFVLSTGGVSVGAYDFVKEALEALGAETKFWRVAMKPGKPVVLSRWRDRLIFGLPGNPASAFVSFHLFAAPALRKAMGQERDLFPPLVHARLESSLRSIGDRRVYFRVSVTACDGELHAKPLASQGSGSLTSMIGANGLAIVEPGVTFVDAGARLPVLLLRL